VVLRRLVWVDRQGRAQPLGGEPNFYGVPRLSPDGRRVAVEMLNDIWVYDLTDRTLGRVSFRGVNAHPVWAPDGRHLTFSSSAGVSSPRLYWSDVDAGGQPEPLTREGGVQFPGSWTPDGSTLGYAETANAPTEADTGWDIWLLRPGSTPSRSPLIRTQFNEDQPMFSPDGRVLAYVSDETGERQVYVRPFPDTGRRVRVTPDGGTEPVWSRRGDELFYRSGRQYFSVPMAATDHTRPGRPTRLFEGDFVVASLIPGAPSYSVAPDGQRFVMVTRAGETPRPTRLDVVLGWVQDLERRLRPAASR
jgi:Tol biopolymer transport system component